MMNKIYLLCFILTAQAVNGYIETMYDGCGETKTCFGFPNDCVKQSDCKVLATARRWTIPWTISGMEFELYSTYNSSWTDYVSPAYVALGFSFDDQIGSDLVHEYVATFPYNPLQVYKSFSIGNTTVRDGPNYDLKIQEASTVDNIYVKYQTYDSILVNGITYYYGDALYLILFAGDRVTENAIGPANLLSPKISQVPVTLNQDTLILNSQ